MSKFKAGLIGAVVIIVFCYLAYTKFANPFSSPFSVKVTFANANGLRPGSFVRIAGVNVGTVNSVSLAPGCQPKPDQAAACQQSEVSMTIDPNGLPLHNDATFWIRPRLFLEGNFFVDLNPGTPEAPSVGSGYSFPISQGREPVQFDQVLDALPYNTRHNLQVLLDQYGTAVKKGGPAYNQSINYWLPAYEYTAIVSHDFLGYNPHDLSNGIYDQGTVSAALDRNPTALKNLIVDFNTTAAAFARENFDLQRTVSELPVTLAAATPAFNALNAAFPPFRALARTLIPGVRSSGPTIDVSLPFIHQLNLLMQPGELRGLSQDLAPTVPALAKLSVATIPLMKNGVRPAASCVANEIIPWSHLTLQDPHFNASNGFPPRPVYVEAVDFLPGLAGESRNFDANGPYIRILGALGDTVAESLSSGLIGGALAPLSGFQPQLPPGDKNPPLEPNVACETQPAVNDLSSPTTAPPQPVSASSAVLAQKKANQRTMLTALAAWAKLSPAQQAAVDRAAAAKTGKTIGAGLP